MSKKNRKILTTSRIDNLHIETLLATNKKNYEIYYEKEKEKIIYNKFADILYLETNDMAYAIKSIKRYHPLRVLTHNKELFKTLKDSGLYTIFHTSYQCGITKSMLTFEPKKLSFNKPLNFEIQSMTKIYSYLDEVDIKLLANNNKLFSIMEGTEPIGYIGEKIDSSVGMLYIFENLREKGYGKSVFAQFSINLLENRSVAFTSIPCNDIAMISLLSDIGYSISNNEIYLLCNKEY